MPQPATAPAVDFAARESALSSRELEIAAREQSIAAREQADAALLATRQREQAVSFAATLADAGRILPRHQLPLIEVLLALPAAPVSFAVDGAAQTAEPAAVLREFLQSLPTQIRYGEVSRDSGAAADPAAFMAPHGTQVNAASAELDRKARAYQASHPNTDYLAAVRAVGG